MRSSDGAGGDRAEHDLLRRAAAEQHRHVVDQLLARLEVAVLLGQVERVAERPAARDDRDLVHAVDAGQQLGAQRVAGLVEGDDAALVLVERAARLHAGHDALERGVEVGLRDARRGARGRRRSPPRCRGWRGRRRSGPTVWRAISARSTSAPSGLSRVCTLQDRLAAGDVGRRDEDLAVEAARAQQRRVELLEQVRGGDHDEVAGRAEAVHLDQQLVERLLALGVVVRAALAADGVDLVDEDDRRAVLARLANRRRMRAAPRPANISTNAAADWEKNCAPDSCATALASSVLPVPGGPCSRMPFGHLRAELREALRVAQELDDLLQLGLRLVGAGDVVPADRRPWTSGLISCGLVRGISFSVRQMKKTSRPMKMIGAQV